MISDGEHGKSSFASYGRTRLSGIEDVEGTPRHRGPTRDSLAFPEAYADTRRMNAARTGPVAYVGQAEVAADIRALMAALEGIALPPFP